MKYQNPIILSDYSDPDVIRVNDNFYMVASSFNHTPILPILKSKDLINWKILRYVKNNLPFERYDNVYNGEGVWAPSIRYHNNKYYIVVPYPDQGIYIYMTDDIENGEFECWPLIEGKGLIDPCPIWTNDKCYLVIGFAKSRIGFNSELGLYEVSTDLKNNISGDYKIIFDGHDVAPTIEGPKFYFRNDYYYILAPAGSVKSGWQVALRSKNIYGPYEMKIVLMQNDSKINGPHQGALVDLADKRDIFIHFQDQGPYGRVICIEPVVWKNNWPLMGDVKDERLAGTAKESGEYFLEPNLNYKIDDSDDFKSSKLSLIWQTPANIKDYWYKLDNGLKLYGYSFERAKNKLNLKPNLFLTKILYKSFNVETKLKLDGNLEAGLCYMGQTYAYITLTQKDNDYTIRLYSGSFDNDDVVLKEIPYDSDEIVFNMKYIEPNQYKLGFNGKYLDNLFIATPGRWIGGKYGIFARGNEKQNACFKYFNVKEIK